MSKNRIISSILSLVLCVSFIIGGTFALFTSTHETNIAVTSGQVELKAAFEIESLFSPEKIDTNTLQGNEVNAATETAFANGGTVTVNGQTVTITNMTPGDKVIFKVTVTNNSNVHFLERTTLTCTDADKSFFNELLVGKSDTANGTYEYYSDFATAWTEGTPVTAPTTSSYYISVELPTFVGDKWQNNSCNLVFSVNAVQGNAATVGGEVSEIIKFTNAADLASTVAAADDGDVIFLSEPADSVDIAFDDAKEVTLRGHKIANLNVNAPSGTLHVFNNVGTLTGENVAKHSLYVYGNIANLVANNGRIVIESSAVVEKVTLDAAENAKLSLLIPETKVEDKVLVAKVNAIEIKAVASTAKVDVKIAETVKDEMDATITGEGKDNATVETLTGAADSFVSDDEAKVLYIGDAAGLRKFAAQVNEGVKYAGYTVNLTNNIDLAGENWTPINGWEGILNNVVIDGNGYSINNMKVDGGDSAGFINNNASSLTIKNITFNNAYVKTTDGNTKYAGVIMGKNYSSVTIENVNVLNSQVRCTWQCGGFVGFSEGNAPTFINCSIKNSFVGGYNCTSGAFFGLGQVELTLDGCTAENVDLYTDMDPGYAGYLYGHTLTANNCTMTDVVVVSTYPAN